MWGRFWLQMGRNNCNVTFLYTQLKTHAQTAILMQVNVITHIHIDTITLTPHPSLSPLGENILFSFRQFRTSPFKICQLLTTNKNKQRKQFIQDKDHHHCCETGVCTGAQRRTRTGHHTHMGDTRVGQPVLHTCPDHFIITNRSNLGRENLLYTARFLKDKPQLATTLG